ncbi:MAG: FecR domain-containing protein [Pseudomonadota bacterium]
MKPTLINTALDIQTQAAHIALAGLKGFGPEEAEAVQVWLDEDPRHRLELELAEDLLLGPELEAALRSAPAGVSADKGPLMAGMWESLRNRLFGGPGLAVAGSLLAVVIAAWLAPVFLTDRAVAPRLETQVHIAGTGAPQSITLADGGAIHLNAASQVRVTYGPDTRRVQLVQGEALFEVFSDPERSFTVEAGETTFTVLGTVFNVDRRGRTVELSVFEGEVAGPSDRYGAGEGARYGGDTAVAFSFDPSEAADWRRGWLEARGLPLGEVMEELQRYSERTILLEPGLEARSVAGRFQLEDAETALLRLAETQGLMVDESASALYVRAP